MYNDVCFGVCCLFGKVIVVVGTDGRVDVVMAAVFVGATNALESVRKEAKSANRNNLMVLKNAQYYQTL